MPGNNGSLQKIAAEGIRRFYGVVKVFYELINHYSSFNIIYIAKGHDEVTTILVGKYHGYFWRKVNQNQQYTACC